MLAALFRCPFAFLFRFICGAAVILLAAPFNQVKPSEAMAAQAAPEIGAWSVVSSPVTDNLKSVSMISSRSGWIVGESGVILRWQGAAWSAFTSPTTQSLYDVKMISANDGWAVGAAGRIIHWDGSAWTIVDSHTSTDLFSVDFTSPTEGWAVGFNSPGGTKRYGEIMRWDGSAWSSFLSNQNNFGYRDIDALASDNAWLAGMYQVSSWPLPDPGYNPRTFVSGHWDGDLWNMKVESHCDNWINAISFTPDNTGWAVGTYGCIMPYNNGWGDRVTGTIGSSILVSIDTVADDDVWAVGMDYNIESQSNAYILHWDGSAWSQVDNPGERGLSAVDMASAYDGWAVGYGGTILHYLNDQGLLYEYLPFVER